MKNVPGYKACGSMTRFIEEMKRARELANKGGKVLLLYHQNPDLLEMGQVASIINGTDVTTVDGTDAKALGLHLDGAFTNILVTNGDRIPISLQAEIGDAKFKWPAGWTIVASRDGGNLMMPNGPWAACFATNAIWRSKPWRGLNERSHQERAELIKQIFQAAVAENGVFTSAPNAFEPMESLIRSKALRGLSDALDIAATACLSASQNGRRTVTAADVATAITCKGPGFGKPTGPNYNTLRATVQVIAE